MVSLLLLAPLFFLFEMWQLVMGERYLGIKQIARNGDPRTLGISEIIAFCWTMSLLAYAGWMFCLLFLSFTRVHAICLLAVSLIGYSLRRNTGIKWVLVIMTFEGAVRIGLLMSVALLAWHRL